MKRYAIHGKNLAALLMLCALLSLLLPFCKVTTTEVTKNISGIGIIKKGANMGAEYYKTGTIKNNYEITKGLSWGEMKQGFSDVSTKQDTNRIIMVGIIINLPIIFCILAILFTLIATGKVTMVFPTLLIAAAGLENIIMILKFGTISSNLKANGIGLTLLIGIYAFTALCIAAFVIIIFLWLTGGFNRPEKGDYDYENDDDRRRKRKKKDGPFKRERRSKKRRKKRKSDRKKSKKSKETNNTNKVTESESKESASVPKAVGRIRGLDGMYEGTNIELMDSKNGISVVGTTPDAVARLKSGAGMEQVEGKYFVINYSKGNGQYMITSHSNTKVIVCSSNHNKAVVSLENGDWITASANSTLFVGDKSNAIRLQ